MIKFKPLFLIALALIALLLGYKEQFFIMFLVVALHELSHIAVAYIFGLKCRSVTFTPLGFSAVIENLEYLSGSKKIYIMLAGPILNLILWLVCEFIFVDRFIFFKQANMAIFLFNMLPVYPLDGGKICHIILGNTIGVMNTNKILMRVGKVITKLMFVIGLVQVILFPFNISLICLSVYLNKVSEKEYENMTFEFYKTVVLNLNKVSMKKQLKLKSIVIDKSNPMSVVIDRLGWDNFHIVHVAEKNQILYTINEFEIIGHVTTKGLSCKFEELL